LLYSIPFQIAAILLIAFLAVRFATSSLRSKMDKVVEEVSGLRATNETLATQLTQPVPTGETASTQAAETAQQTAQAIPRLTISDGGHALTLDTRGVLETGGLVPAKYLRLVGSALHTGRLSTPSALLGSLGRQTRSAAENDAFQLIAPLGVVTIADRPLFRWTSLNEAKSYSVQIRDASTDQQFESNPVAGTEWVPEKPLDRGHTYSWAIVATLPGDDHVYVPRASSPAAMFQVLDKSASDELETADTRPNRSHLLLAILYAQNGLIGEADRELSALQIENPKCPAITSLQRSLKRNPRR
jgi:hypothetical protein